MTQGKPQTDLDNVRILIELLPVFYKINFNTLKYKTVLINIYSATLSVSRSVCLSVSTVLKLLELQASNLPRLLTTPW